MEYVCTNIFWVGEYGLLVWSKDRRHRVCEAAASAARQAALQQTVFLVEVYSKIVTKTCIQ